MTENDDDTHRPCNLAFNKVAHTPGVRLRFDCTCGRASNLITHGKDADEAKEFAEAICASHLVPLGGGAPVNNPERSIFPGVEGDRSHWATPNGCGCMTCVEAMLAEKPWPENLNHPFIVCPNCGNKRCPKATHHANTCTNSNEVGQPGSAYELPPT